MKDKQKLSKRRNFRLAIALIVALLLVVFGFYLVRTKRIVPSAQVVGPSLSLPDGKGAPKIDVGSNFNVDIILDTDGQPVASVDTHLSFDPQMLEVQDADLVTDGTQIQKGGLFPDYSNNQTDNSLGKINLSASTTAQDGVSGREVFATITFKALTDGTANVNFDFTAGLTTDCNIWHNTLSPPQDILAGVENGTYTIGNPSTPTPTPTPSSGGGRKKTPTPTPTPQTPTPQITVSETPTPTPENTPEPGVSIGNLPAPAASPTKTPTPSPRASNIAFFSPSPSRTIMPSASPTPVLSAGQKLAKGIKWFLILAIPIALILGGYLVWLRQKKKKYSIKPDEPEKKDIDDELKI